MYVLCIIDFIVPHTLGVFPTASADDPVAEAGAWRHGWQFHACSKRNRNFREHVVLPSVGRRAKAMMRSSSGDKPGFWLQTLPTCDSTRLEPRLFLAALRRRLFLPLPLVPRACGGGGQPGCGHALDTPCSLSKDRSSCSAS